MQKRTSTYKKTLFQPIFNVTMTLQKEMKLVFLGSEHYSKEIQEITHACSNLYPNL